MNKAFFLTAGGWFLVAAGVLALVPVVLAFVAYRYRPRLSAERICRYVLAACRLSPLLVKVLP